MKKKEEFFYMLETDNESVHKAKKAMDEMLPQTFLNGTVRAPYMDDREGMLGLGNVDMADYSMHNID